MLASPNSLEAYFELSIGTYLHVDSYLIKEVHSELLLWCAVLHKSLSLMTPLFYSLVIEFRTVVSKQSSLVA